MFSIRTTKGLNDHPRLNDFELDPARVAANEVTMGNRTPRSPSMNPSDSGVSADLCPAKRAPSFQFHVSGSVIV